jgi:two-component sensor histidine kinase
MLTLFLDLFFQGLDCNTQLYALKIIFGQLYVIGLSFYPVMWLFFIYSLINRGKLFSKKLRLTLLIIPFIGLILALTNPWTNLYYINVFKSNISTNLQLGYTINWGFLLTFYYDVFIRILSLGLIFYNLFKLGEIYKKTLIILLIINFIGLILNFLSYSNLYSPFLYTIKLIVLFFAIVTMIFLIRTDFNLYSIINKGIVKKIDVGIVFFDLNDKLVSVNPICSQLGIKNEDIKKSVNVIFKNNPEILEFYNNPNSNVLDLNLGNLWFNIVKKPMIYKGDNFGKILTFEDVTSEKWELNQKDQLINEVNHRVKNNLQIILSLLNLNVRFYSSDPMEVINDTKSRLNYMSVLHEKIYKSTSFTEVDIEDYLPDLINSLINMHNSNIVVNNNISSFMLDLDIAIPIGLIVTEIVNNTIKFSFPNNESGNLYVNFNVEDTLGILDLYDDGVGLPDGFNLNDSSDLGMTVVQTLTNQIEGKVKIVPDNGAHFEIIFPIGNFSKKIWVKGE